VFEYKEVILVYQKC